MGIRENDTVNVHILIRPCLGKEGYIRSENVSFFCTISFPLNNVVYLIQNFSGVNRQGK